MRGSEPAKGAYLKGQVLGGLIVEDGGVEDADHDGGHALHGGVPWQRDESIVGLSILLHREYELAVLVLQLGISYTPSRFIHDISQSSITTDKSHVCGATPSMFIHQSQSSITTNQSDVCGVIRHGAPCT